MLYISYDAQKYIKKLLNQQKKGTHIRIFLKNLNTPYPKSNICYYFPNPHKENDVIVKFDLFSVYLNKSITHLIKDTKIELISNNTGTNLQIHSPNLNTTIENTAQNITNKSSLADKIKHILDYQINPQLSMHGGYVSLIQVTQDPLAVLKFHGGCNGCTMAYYTLKEGIEKTLKKIFPELKGVIDITQHTHGTHSFY